MHVEGFLNWVSKMEGFADVMGILEEKMVKLVAYT